jgi:high affinity Mn2+ porin
VVELNQRDWALRIGYFLLADDPNNNNFDMRLFRRGQYVAEFEDRYTILGSSGKFRLTGWESQCYCGSFAAALTNPTLANPAFDANAPDIAATRKARSEFGFIANFEQTVTDDLGLFARLSWQSGQTEIMQWTDIDETASFGGVLKGTSWGRPDDVIGLAGVVNGLSGNYRPEGIMETFYSAALSKWAALSFDYQFVGNPGYNSARGPVSIGAVRLHLQF